MSIFLCHSFFWSSYTIVRDVQSTTVYSTVLIRYMADSWCSVYQIHGSIQRAYTIPQHVVPLHSSDIWWSVLSHSLNVVVCTIDLKYYEILHNNNLISAVFHLWRLAITTLINNPVLLYWYKAYICYNKIIFHAFKLLFEDFIASIKIYTNTHWQKVRKDNIILSLKTNLG